MTALKTVFLLLLAATLNFSGLTVFNKIRFRYDWSNAFWRTAMDPMEGTIWADRFSESTFSQITLNMHQQDVERIVGQPLRKSCDEDGCFWRYTDQETGTADFDR